MKLLPTFSDRAITLRDNGALKVHHSPADILAAEAPIVMSNQAFQPVEPSMYVLNGLLCLPDLTGLPIDRCIKTNRPAATIMMVSLRNPLNPLTWWDKNPRAIMIGLSAAAHSTYRDIVASARISLIAAIATFICGWILSPLFFVASLGLVVAAGLLKSCKPVRVEEISNDIIVVKGVSPEYLRDVTVQTSLSQI